MDNRTSPPIRIPSIPPPGIQHAQEMLMDMDQPPSIGDALSTNTQVAAISSIEADSGQTDQASPGESVPAPEQQQQTVSDAHTPKLVSPTTIAATITLAMDAIAFTPSSTPVPAPPAPASTP